MGSVLLSDEITNKSYSEVCNTEHVECIFSQIASQ